MMHKNVYKILLADNQFLIRFALKTLISEIDGFTILGEVFQKDELIQSLNTQKPDILIIDYNQSPFFELETIHYIIENHPNIEILVISSDNDKENIYEIIQLGVTRFLTKKCEGREIKEALTAITRGEKYFCNRIFEYIFEKSFSQTPILNEALPLSPRELEIVQYIAKGLVAKEISSKLNLSTHTVYTHRKNIMEKLKLRRQSELVLFAVNNGLVL